MANQSQVCVDTTEQSCDCDPDDPDIQAPAKELAFYIQKISKNYKISVKLKFGVSQATTYAWLHNPNIKLRPKTLESLIASEGFTLFCQHLRLLILRQYIKRLAEQLSSQLYGHELARITINMLEKLPLYELEKAVRIQKVFQFHS